MKYQNESLDESLYSAMNHDCIQQDALKYHHLNLKKLNLAGGIFHHKLQIANPHYCHYLHGKSVIITKILLDLKLLKFVKSKRNAQNKTL